MYYRNKKHRDEFVQKMSNDKECQQGYEEWVNLLSLNSKVKLENLAYNCRLKQIEKLHLFHTSILISFN